MNEALPAAVRARVGAPAAGWSAELELGFRVVAGRSALVRNRHCGPLAVQRAFYPESPDLAHVYLLHPPGGIVAGDQLTVRVDVQSGARALITTPAATKFYRSEGQVAHTKQLLHVAEGSSLEWLPQETIVFGSAQARTETRVELAPGGAFCGWEVVCLGRAASGDHFTSGRLEQAFEIWQGPNPLWIERSQIGATDAVRHAAWGLAGQRVLGTFVHGGTHRSPLAASAPVRSGRSAAVPRGRAACPGPGAHTVRRTPVVLRGRATHRHPAPAPPLHLSR